MNYSAAYKEKIVQAYLEGHLTPEGAFLLFDMSWTELELMAARYQKYGLKGLTIKHLGEKNERG